MCNTWCTLAGCGGGRGDDAAGAEDHLGADTPADVSGLCIFVEQYVTSKPLDCACPARFGKYSLHDAEFRGIYCTRSACAMGVLCDFVG